MKHAQTFAIAGLALAMALPSFGTVAQAQEQMQEAQVSVVYSSCYTRTRYIRDGFEVYPAGTERVCDYLLSNGEVITVVGMTYA